MNDDSDAAEARSAFKTPENIVIELQRFFRNSKREFAWLQDKRLARLHDDATHDALNGAFIADIDVWMFAVFEDAEFAAEAEIDGAASELFGRQLGVDPNFAAVDVAANIDIRKDHGGVRERLS